MWRNGEEQRLMEGKGRWLGSHTVKVLLRTSVVRGHVNMTSAEDSWWLSLVSLKSQVCKTVSALARGKEGAKI